MTNQPTRRRFTAVFKAQVVPQILRDDKTLAQIAAEHGVHPNQLSQWKATVLGAMPALFEKDGSTQAAEKAAQEKQVAELYEQIGRLTTQLAWIKRDYLKSGLDPEPK